LYDARSLIRIVLLIVLRCLPQDTLQRMEPVARG